MLIFIYASYSNMQISLRKTTLEDLGTLFVFQADEEANYIAAFNVEDPNDKDAYMNKWSKIIANPSVNMQTILQIKRCYMPEWLMTT